MNYSSISYWNHKTEHEADVLMLFFEGGASMKYCTRCKMEYTDGSSVCADCGGEAVEDGGNPPELDIETERNLFGWISKLFH